MSDLRERLEKWAKGQPFETMSGTRHARRDAEEMLALLWPCLETLQRTMFSRGTDAGSINAQNYNDAMEALTALEAKLGGENEQV